MKDDSTKLALGSIGLVLISAACTAASAVNIVENDKTYVAIFAILAVVSFFGSIVAFAMSVMEFLEDE